jgi:dienelactone hydrolase
VTDHAREIPAPVVWEIMWKIEGHRAHDAGKRGVMSVSSHVNIFRAPIERSTPWPVNRRRFLRMTLGVAALPLSGCGTHHAALKHCPVAKDDFETLTEGGFEVLRTRPACGPTILLLHEVTGLSPDNLALARCLAREGFTVYAPVLFGKAWDDKFIGGYRASCGSGMFNCPELKARSKILDRLEPLADALANRAKARIGAIGMCLTGIMPLALLPNQVAAAVVCQPTLPFSVARRGPNDQQAQDLGLGDADFDEAVKASSPFLALHYLEDRACPVKRIQTLEKHFPSLVATIGLPGGHRHSTLSDDLDTVALADTVAYLRARLHPDAPSARMQLARLNGHPCEITAAGWRQLAS